MYGRPPTGSLSNRPGSRAGAAGSSWGRPQGQAPPGMPPRTGVQMPPGTANRINQARPGTAARINVIDRPTTQQGLGGIRIKNQGPGRMVQDVTFFQNELRQKVNILAEEIYRINTEIDTVTKENSNYATFEKRADTLAEELKELQGQLGDLNTLVDKLHTDTDLDELERQYNQLKAKNQRESQVLDEIFMQRQQREATIRDIEKQIGEERQKAEEQINELDPARRAEYLRLKDENDKHLAAISRFQDGMEQMAQKSQAMQLELSQDLIKQKAVSLHERLNEVREKKRELEEAIKKAENESGPQEKARLLDQVKEDNLETSGMERKITELEDQIRKIKEQISQADAELDPAQNERNAKYEELLKRDRDMQAFLDSFDEKRHECLTRNQDSERNIVELLERIKTMSKKDMSNLPSADGFKELQGDLVFKEKEMQNSENTMEALVQERDRRMQDLEKVGQLETKLNAELKHLREKQQAMTDDMSKIRNIDGIKREAELTKKKNATEREDLQLKRDSMRIAVQMITNRYEAKKAQLHENETYTQLGALEQRLRHHEGVTYGFKDYIASKTAESDYKSLVKDVLKRMDELNGQLGRLMAMPAAR